MSLDFTIDKYRELCEAMRIVDILTFSDYLRAEELPSKYVILRHDVDRKPGNALMMAGVERDLGIRSTYYFRMRRGVFEPGIIRAIADMGHEVGYHYETLDKSKGDHEKALSIFRYELGKFREICEVETVCMHGNPLTRWDNKSIWQGTDFSQFQILGEAFLSSPERLNYFTDTGRTWNWKYRRKDRLERASGDNLDVHSTDDLIDFMIKADFGVTYINVHPERWSNGFFEWGARWLMETVMNIAKRTLFAVRG